MINHAEYLQGISWESEIDVEGIVSLRRRVFGKRLKVTAMLSVSYKVIKEFIPPDKDFANIAEGLSPCDFGRDQA